MNWAVPIATLAFAGVSLILSSFFAFRSLSRSASADWVTQLEKRVSECERDRADLHKQIVELRDREFYLMSKLIEKGGASG